MRFYSMASIFMALIISATNLHAENIPTACTSLSSLGITSFNNNNIALPMWIPGSPSCKAHPGEQCYATWNFTKQSTALGWNIIIEASGTNAETAFANLNKSQIFNALPTKVDSLSASLDCQTSVDNVNIFMWYHHKNSSTEFINNTIKK